MLANLVEWCSTRGVDVNGLIISTCKTIKSTAKNLLWLLVVMFESQQEENIFLFQQKLSRIFGGRSFQFLRGVMG